MLDKLIIQVKQNTLNEANKFESGKIYDKKSILIRVNLSMSQGG